MPLVTDQPINIRIKSETKVRIERLSSESDSSKPKFPRIEDCAHFHYDTVDHGLIKFAFAEESKTQSNRSSLIDEFNYTYTVRVTSKNKCWVVKRNLTHFITLDQLLHECVFDRKYSLLPVLKAEDMQPISHPEIYSILRSYLARLSEITDSNTDGGQIFCAPVLHWFGIDSHGRTLVSHALGDVADINIPAVAAARVVRRYQAVAEDELTLDVGDMVSIIEMPPTGWWRGKQGLKVGSFPSQCVKRISSATDVVGTHQRPFVPPQYNSTSEQMPISKKHGKIMVLLRSFLDTRPTKSALKKKGILRERVFGCDLGELLHRSGEEVPTIVSDCTRFVEKHGVVDGIYRISGVASHIRFLKYEFDSDRRPDLDSKIEGLPELSTSAARRNDDDGSMCDPHSVAGLCKLFFRELPNPLLTYQLYNRFATAVSDFEAEERLLKVHDAIQQLPPPHYRTLKHLISHLQHMAQKAKSTSMHCRNLAIVWAPNLLRSREIEAGLAAFTEARVQSVVIEFLIANADLLFSEQLQTKQYDAENKPPRPKSLMFLPATKLISLEEAQARSRSGIVSPILDKISPSQATVRMRDWGDKSSSERRKRRQKKSTSTNIVLRSESPRAPRTTKKFGHRQTHSVYEANFSFAKTGEIIFATPSPTKAVSPVGWKGKLGSLLKKTQPQQTTVTKQASLRRTKSDDSLYSSSSQKQLQETGRKKQRPKSLYADRNRSDSQITFFQEEFTKSSPSKSRKKQTPKKGSPTKTRAKRTESEGYSVERRDTFEIKFRKVNHRNTVHGSGFSLPAKQKLGFDLLDSTSPDRQPSPNPFAELSSDFPNVMGEGIGFDPLSYRSVRQQAPLWKDIVVPPFKPVDEETSKPSKSNANPVNSRKAPSNSDPIPKVTISVKRVESVRSVHGEPVFAAVSSLAPASRSENAIDPSRQSEFETLTADGLTPSKLDAEDSNSPVLHELNTATSKLSLANRNSNNNSVLRDEIAQSSPLDGLTAECVGLDAMNPETSFTPRVSIAEKLGIKRKTSKSSRNLTRCPVEIPTSILEEKLNEVGLDNLSHAATKNLTSIPEHEAHVSRNRGKQVYDLPTKSTLRKDVDHYGSVIALIGSCNDSPCDTTPESACVTAPLSARERTVSPISPILYNINQKRSQKVKSKGAEPKEHSCTNFNKPKQLNKSYSVNLQNRPLNWGRLPRLDTFNPDGKKREGYEELNLSPRYPTSQFWSHPHSRSCDSSPLAPLGPIENPKHYLNTANEKLNATRTIHTQGDQKVHSNGLASMQQARPKPAPRKHFRSHSAGDSLDQTNFNSIQKPTPMPRTLRQQSVGIEYEETVADTNVSQITDCQLSPSSYDCALPTVQYLEIDTGSRHDEPESTYSQNIDPRYAEYSVFQNTYKSMSFVKESLVG